MEQPAVFKTTGMPWQDLALAIAVSEAYSSQGSDQQLRGVENGREARPGSGSDRSRSGSAVDSTRYS